MTKSKVFCPMTWKYFTLNLWLCRKAFSIPYFWCTAESKMKICSKGSSKLRGLICLNLFYITYLSITIYYDWTTTHIYQRPEIFGDIVMRIEYLIVCSNVVVLMLNTLILSTDYLRYFNEWINLYVYFSNRYVMGKFKPWELPCAVILEMISFSYVLLPLGQLVHFFELPYSKTYITWLFKDLNMPVITVAVCFIQCVLMVIIIFGNYCAAVFHVFMCLIPMSICIKALKESRPGVNPFLKFKTVNLLRTPKESLKIYNAHYILNQQANIIGSHLLYGLQTLGSYAVVLSLICLLHFGFDVGYKTGFIVFIVGSFGFLLWLTILETGGIFTNKTKLWIGHWSKAVWPRNCNKKYCMKVAKSLKPLQMNFSGCYKLTLLRVLRFINFIMWTAMKGLLFISKD